MCSMGRCVSAEWYRVWTTKEKGVNVLRPWEGAGRTTGDIKTSHYSDRNLPGCFDYMQLQLYYARNNNACRASEHTRRDNNINSRTARPCHCYGQFTRLVHILCTIYKSTGKLAYGALSKIDGNLNKEQQPPLEITSGLVY